MNPENTNTVNPKGLPTFTGTIETEDALHSAFETSPLNVVNERMSLLISALQGHHHTLQDSDGDQSIFACFPGLGRASVTDTVLEDFENAGQTTNGTQISEYTRTPVFKVVITHPAMGRGKGEVHLCTTYAEVLAVLATVSYG
jgi:hypothetical protein